MLKFAQMTDIHIDVDDNGFPHVETRDNFSIVLKDALDRGISQVVFTGDLVEDENEPWFWDTVAAAGLKYDIILGNHDRAEHLAAYYPQFRERSYYHHTVENLLCIYMDSSAGVVDDAQLHWLQDVLAGNTLPVVLFIHHPVLDCGGTMGDRLMALRNRDDVRRILQEAGQPVSIFSGHYHNEFYVSDGQVEQFVSPSVYFQANKFGDKIWFDNTIPAYRIITFDDGKVSSEVLYLR